MLLLILSAISFLVDAKIAEIPLPKDVKACFEHSKTRQGGLPEIGEVVFSRCVQRILWKPKPKADEISQLGDDAKTWFSHLLEMNRMYDVYEVKGHVAENRINTSMEFTTLDAKAHAHFREKRQTRGSQTRGSQTRRQPRVRKEYRMLSDRERALFHRAVNMLKQDRTVSPNKFDALGRLHYLSVGRGHDGPNFFPWHRLFLVVFENALREKIPSVTIPYWDNTLDDNLLDPRSSVMWTPEFMGTANGYVNDGPFANWNTPMGPLIRYFGTAGTMLNWTYIKNSLRKNHLEEITSPFANPEDNLEEHHNQVHLWVGGHMAPPSLAAFDPVFYMLHSFTDLLWEIFRGVQKRRGIDPSMDYPRNRSALPAGQSFNDPSGFGTLLNRHALSDVFIDNIYKYDRPPYCNAMRPTCGSDNIRCDTSGPEPRCVSASVFDIRPLTTLSGLPMSGSSGIREIRSTRRRKSPMQKVVDTVKKASAAITCQSSNIDERYVNNFNIDGVRDVNDWVYMPVKVVYTNRSREQGNGFEIYNQCKDKNKSKHAENIPVRVLIESNGVSYQGTYKEIVHFRSDLLMSQEVTYIGMKKPRKNGISEVIVSGYDTCGRVCQPYCLNIKDGTYKKCTGTLRITDTKPLQFEYDVTSASSGIWQEDISGHLTLRTDTIFLSFVCSKQESYWPW